MKDQQITNIIQALDSFTFSVKDYLQDGGTSVNRLALVYLANRLGTDAVIQIDVLVSRILKGKCINMMIQGAKWLCVPQNSRSQVACIIEGVRFSGTVTIEPKKIQVKVTNGGKTRTCIIHPWSSSVFTEEPYIGSRSTPEGERCARNLFLETCYEELYC